MSLKESVRRGESEKEEKKKGAKQGAIQQIEIRTLSLQLTSLLFICGPFFHPSPTRSIGVPLSAQINLVTFTRCFMHTLGENYVGIFPGELNDFTYYNTYNTIASVFITDI